MFTHCLRGLKGEKNLTILPLHLAIGVSDRLSRLIVSSWSGNRKPHARRIFEFGLFRPLMSPVPRSRIKPGFRVRPPSNRN
jgi:hypothetical protein